MKALFGLWLFACLSIYGQGLASLEKIVSPFDSLSAFLSDEAAVSKYGEALKLYLGDDDSFGPVYVEFIRQLREVNAQVDGFGKQAWEFNPNWDSQRFSFQGKQSGTGLESKRESIFEALHQIQSQSKEEANAVLEREHRRSFAAELIQHYQLLSTKKLAGASRREKLNHSLRVGGSTGGSSLANHPHARSLAAFFINQLLTHKEDLTDALHSGDADIIASQLKKMRKPSAWKEYLEKSNLSEEEVLVLPYLIFQNNLLEELIESYETAVRSMKEIRHIRDARLDVQVLNRLEQLQAQGVQAADLPQHLSIEEAAAFERWRKASAETNSKKTEIKEAHNAESKFFFYDLYPDPARNTLRLKADASVTAVEFIPTPRPFHVFLAGRKTGECVGGRILPDLAPKRWARGALKGSESLFVETEKDKMGGLVGLTLLEHQAHGAYHVVDIMSVALKGEIILEGPSGLVKYSVFDLFVDRYNPKSNGLVISDGESVSANVGGREVVLASPAYLEDVRLGAPEDFKVVDPMAGVISERFPKILNNYGRGGMVFDGMRGDGSKVVRLVPTASRRKRTKEELEGLVMKDLIMQDTVDDRSAVWKLARENGLVLKSLAEYRQSLTWDSPLWYLGMDALLVSQVRDEISKGLQLWEEKIDAAPTNRALFTPLRFTALQGIQKMKYLENLCPAHQIMRQIVTYHPDLPELQQTLFRMLNKKWNEEGIYSPQLVASIINHAIKDSPESIDFISMEVIQALKELGKSEDALNALEVLTKIMQRQPENQDLISADFLIRLEEKIYNGKADTPGFADYAAGFILEALRIHKREKALASDSMILALKRHGFGNHSEVAIAALQEIVRNGLNPSAVTEGEIRAHLSSIEEGKCSSLLANEAKS